ncbi:MAG: endolytic transglycosylase MltG [Clostridiales Family XIII bacterium]|jgi:hypothetical protein|nr:endolytic transglycosylase MltG [Clostridiales Family XIII bacterium]
MKNFLYNKSDLFVALAIIVIAAFIIWTRINAIMDFPSNENPDAETNNAAVAGEDAVDPDAATDPNATTESPADAGNASNDPPAQQPAAVQFVVEPGQATSTIADNLLAANLIPTKEEFLSAVRSMGVESRLKAGTFNIPTGMSVPDIINILTK